jgi:hypothetical protein
MIKYPIERWDAIMVGGDVNIRSPMIYIKPDLDFLEFAEANSFEVYVEVTGTGLSIDNITIPATVNKSCNVPNPRPNYFAKTGQYVVILHTPWIGYPNSLGTATFKGLKTVTVSADVEKFDEKMPKPLQGKRHNNNNDNKCMNSMSKTKIFGIVALLMLTLFLAIYYARGTKSYSESGTNRIFY